MYLDEVLSRLVPGDVCLVCDGNYSRAAGQEVIVMDDTSASEMRPPDEDNRIPCLIPESGRVVLLDPNTPVRVR